MPDAMSKVQSHGQKAGEISIKLLRHYDAHARDLPWRTPPSMQTDRRPDPYHVWLSEIMLQQTTVAAVKPYFDKFTSLWPTVSALAAADEAEVMAAWAGLGYYARARNLVKCARTVSREMNGTFPDSEDALLALPGIGPYTAAAIAAIAFGHRAVVVDANIERVVSRLYRISTPLPAAKPQIRAAADAITPAARAGDFAQAMMDLGAGLCSVKSPECQSCPINGNCAAYAAGEAVRYPVKPPKKAKPVRTGAAYWIEHDAMVWLVKRPGKGMLGGMRALPDDGWRAGADGDAQPPFAGDWQMLDQTVAHVFTHFSLNLSICVLRGSPDAVTLPHGEWWPVARIDDAGLPTLFAKAARIAMAA